MFVFVVFAYLMDFCKHCLNCYCCSYQACVTSQSIDNWHATEACGFGCLYCYACCWTLCAPLCIDCKLGDFGVGIDHFGKGCKFFILSCCLRCVAPLDGLYNCFRICGYICGEDKLVKRYG